MTTGNLLQVGNRKVNKMTTSGPKNHLSQEDTKKEIFFFTGNKVTFFKKPNTLTPVLSVKTLPNYQRIPPQYNRDTYRHLSHFTGNKIYPDQDVVLLISQRRIVIFYTLAARNR